MIDLLLMSKQPRYRLLRIRWIPQEHGVVVASRDEALGDSLIDGCGFVESFFGFDDLGVYRVWDLAGVIVEGGSEDEIGRESEVVYPMGV